MHFNRVNYTKVLALVAFLLGSQSTFAKVDEFKFSSRIIEVTQVDADLGSIKVSLHGVSLPLLINGDTEIRSDGDEIGIPDLSIEDFIKVDVFFAPEGLVAEEIEVLGQKGEHFRLQGTLSGSFEMDGDLWLELLGLEVKVSYNATITRRGSRSGNDVDPASLVAGDEINVSGLFEDAQLQATRIHVGNREQGDIELEGEVSELTDNTFSLLLDSGVNLSIVLDANTEVSGILADNVDVEIEGRFNENLTILAFEVVVDDDGDGDADDDNRRHGRTNDKFRDRDDSDDDASGNDDPGLEISQETRLAADDSDLSGKAEFKLVHEDSEIEQEVEIEIEDAPVDTEYAIVIFFGDTSVAFGTFTTNQFGTGKAEFKTDADDPDEQDLTPLLPAGIDVTAITTIQIQLNGNVVLEGDF